MKFTHPIYTLLVALCIFSCEDKFIKDIDIDIPENEQLLVINLEINEGATEAETFVARTTNINEAESTFYEDAIVELYKDENLVSVLDYDMESNKYKADFSSAPISQGTYRVEVSGVDGLTDISATQTIPNKVNITKGKYKANGTVYQYYYYAETVDEAIITFPDPADEDNYYMINLFIVIDDANGNNIGRRSLFVSSLNPFVEPLFYSQGLILKDDSFNGTEVDISIGFSNYLVSYGPTDDEEIYLEAELKSITRDNYLYLRSLEAFRNTNGNPFAEPVIVHNNIENGIGIFRAGNTSTFRIDFE